MYSSSSAAKKKRKQCLKMTPEMLIESNERARLQKMKSRLGMSHDKKAKMREKAKNTMNRLRDACLLTKRPR
jgi:hypothetical protein